MDSPDSIISPTLLLRRRSTVSSCHYSSSAASSSPEHTVDSAMTPYSDQDMDSYIMPKLEELENPQMFGLSTLEETKPSNSGDDAATLVPKKPGRPRKHSSATIDQTKKTSRVRSKTGCGTCRRRKKKCDEAKPTCMNCEKNNVVCDGYEPKQAWTSGRQRSHSVRMAILQKPAVVPSDLPPLIPGVDGAVDQLFFQYFLGHLGKVLCLADEASGSTPFLDLIVPMAMGHQGLMHSLLYLSGSCLSSNDAKPHPEWVSRTDHHSSHAMRVLQTDLSASTASQAGQSTIKDKSIAQTLLLCLQTVCAGDTTGSYRFHLNAMKEMLVRQVGEERNTPSASSPRHRTGPFRTFILEALLYLEHNAAITTSTHSLDQRSAELMALLIESAPNGQGHFIGVLDGLFGLMARTRQLRDKVRIHRDQRKRRSGSWDNKAISPMMITPPSSATSASPTGFMPMPGMIPQTPTYWTDANITQEAFAIDAALRSWSPPPSCPPESPRYATSLLYRQCAWLYLRRTIRESKADDEGRNGVEEGLGYLHAAMDSLPSSPASTTFSSEGEMEGNTTSMQPVLLLPLFLLGTAAYDATQRVRLTETLERLQKGRRTGNIKLTKTVVEEEWRLMDTGSEEESWDWEGVMTGRGWDFVVV